MLIKKVLLINLPEEGACADFYTPSYTIGSFSTYPPLGLLYIATAIKDKYPVEILDTVALKYSTEEIVKKRYADYMKTEAEILAFFKSQGVEITEISAAQPMDQVFAAFKTAVIPA